MKFIKHYIPLLLIMINACSPNHTIQLQDGDLLFRGKSGGHLSNAIDEVTQTKEETHFSHVGIVEIIDGKTYVMHASTNGGTCKISLNDFINPGEDSLVVVAYRLKDKWQPNIKSALERANKMLGKPYNSSYVLSDSAHYCSEFIYRAFEADSIFSLSPMTFKDPATKEFHPYWIDYYKKLNIEIPEGLPGCNPNGMAASEELIKLGTINQSK